MNLIEHLLEVLAEEGCEIARECQKSNRFGIDDTDFTKPDGPNNRQRIVDELNDLFAVVEMCVNAGLIPGSWYDRDKIAAKQAKVQRCLAYARERGALIDSIPQRVEKALAALEIAESWGSHGIYNMDVETRARYDALKQQSKDGSHAK